MNDQDKNSHEPEPGPDDPRVYPSYPDPAVDDKLHADPVVEARITRLDEALHGTADPLADGPVNWSGTDETDTTFNSIAQLLAGSFPTDRPETDLPGYYKTRAEGS